MSYHDDNYGAWEGMEPSHPDYEDNLEFYRQTQATNIEKECVICGCMVMIQPQYDKCGSCADAIEQGRGY